MENTLILIELKINFSEIKINFIMPLLSTIFEIIVLII